MLGGVAAFVAVLALVAFAHALTFPQLSGRVVDEANILDAATRQALTDKLAAVEAKSGDQIVVVTLRSLQDTSIEDYGYQLGRQWGIGQKGTNNGALLIVVPSEHRVRIEVGYGLEGALTDAVTRLIIQNAILPRFRANDFAGGITRGVDDIVQVVSGDAEEFKRRAAQRPDNTPQGVDVMTLILIAFVLFAIFRALRGSGGGGPGRGYGRSGYAGPIFIPSGGSWSSGSSGSSSGGFGGGFSGGGGSFGGGGSSGSW
ncbi:MAG: TPM domain-containing protein [Xanthobacteraceae bacterium]